MMSIKGWVENMDKRRKCQDFQCQSEQELLSTLLLFLLL